MYAYQDQKNNDRVCIQFKSRQVPAETPDIILEKDEENMINLYVAGALVWSGAGTFADGGDEPDPDESPC